MVLLLLLLLLFLPDVFGNSGQKIFDSTVRVVEGSAHGGLDLAPLKTHRLHVGNGLGALSAHGQARGFI